MPAEPNVKSGALLGFKVGLQTTVDTMLAAGANANAQHGCFYLTKDAHRLYVGNEDGSLSAVNEGIEWLSHWDDLQDIAATAASSVSGAKYLTGRFYYVNDRNVLCVYNGRNWVQLNENTNTTLVSNVYAIATSNDVATIANTITDSGSGTYADTFTITGANGIKITGSGKAITLTGDTYTLSSNQSGNNVEIKLDSTETNNDSVVTLVRGSNITLTKAADSNNVTIAAQDTVNQSATINSLATGFNFIVTDSKGDTVTATTNPQISVFTSSDPTATSSTSGATNSVSFTNGTAVLDVYSRQAIDSKLEAVNAMTYRGTAGNDGTVADYISYDETTGVTTISKNNTAVPVSIGDTFLMTDDGTYNGVSYKAGSLLIVRAKDGRTEGADGTIAAGDFICDVVAERWNTDTHYSLQGITNGVQLHANTGDNVGSIVINSGDNWIGIAQSGTSDKVLTITHQSVTRSDTENKVSNSQQITRSAGGTVTIPAVVGVTSDTKGHVTGITVQDYVLGDTSATLTSMGTTTTAYNDTTNNYTAGVVNTTATLQENDGTEVSRTSSVVFSSSSLTITDNDTRPTTAGGSTTPGGLAIEMLWGSF